ncbi:MAG: hypothetical protein GY790_15590 [Bacteroidetes bacterium]|nr:hypothetical protein [Bacteroidota bacterium]
MKYNYFHTIVLMLVAIVSQVHAENIIINTDKDTLYVYDDFDITGSLLHDNDNGISGAGWSGRWAYTSDASIAISVTETESLSYPSGTGASGSGGYIEHTSNGQSSIERSFANTYGLLNSTFYLSLLVQKDASGSFTLLGFGGGYARYGLRINEPGSMEVRASANWSDPSEDGSFANDLTYLLVLAKEGQVNKIALFEEGDAIPADPAAVNWIVSESGKSGVEMDRFQLIFSQGNVKIDELRLGSTLQSVTSGTAWLGSISAATNLAIDPDTVSNQMPESPVQLNWTDNSDNEKGYIIYKDGSELARTAADITSHEVTAEYRNPAYYFNVAAYNDDGVSMKSNTAVLTVLNPSGIYAEVPGNGATLYQTIPFFSWTHQHTGPFSGYYEIEIDDHSDFSSPLDADTVPVFINYYCPDFELEYNTIYYWRLRFVNNESVSEGGWSRINSFRINQPEAIVDVLPGDGWDEIRSKWQTVLSLSETTPGAVELRFPIDGEFNVRQDPVSDEGSRSNGFLLYVDGYDHVLVNGRGSKITIEATHGEWLCGFMEVNNSRGMQVKDIIIDYHPNSLYQIGGVVKNFNKEARTFEVIVDTSVYKTYDVLKHYTEGYFLSSEHSQKIGLKGVDFEMEETWEQARVNDTTFKFTCGSSEYGRYKDELEDGDYFVLSHRGGDVVFLSSGVDNFVLNNMTTHASRGRYFAIDAGCSNSRCLNNNYLRTQGRIMGSSSGGVGVDRGDNVWYEGNRYEYSRDDMFHNGSNAGKGSVFRKNSLIGAYRNSVWVQADRTWVADNVVEYAGQSGIHIGYAPSDPGTMPDVVLVEGNIIRRPNWRGIRLNTNVNRPDWETGSIYNENILIRNNHIIDNFRDEAIQIDYAKNVILENNLITNTIDEWSVYSDEDFEIGIHVSNSENVSGTGNQVLDNRLSKDQLLIVDDNCVNVQFELQNVPDTTVQSVPQAAIDNDMKVYPNPSVNGMFTFSRYSDFNVFTQTGSMIKKCINTNYIDLSDWSSGIYILFDERNGARYKLVKSN